MVVYDKNHQTKRIDFSFLYFIEYKFLHKYYSHKTKELIYVYDINPNGYKI